MCYTRCMNDKNIENTVLTPVELANKLDSVIYNVQKLTKYNLPENEWARKSVELHEDLYLEYLGDSSLGVALPLSKVKELCPELYNQLIKPAIDIANKANKSYKAPESPAYVILDNQYKNACYNSSIHSIEIGIPYLRSKENMQEAIAVISHEWTHAYQDLENRITKNLVTEGILPSSNKNKRFARSYCGESHVSELHADRGSEAMNKIASSISDLMRDYESFDYGFCDERSAHPNHRKRIKALLEKELGNEIFGMNGKWENDSFVPNSFVESGNNIKNIVRGEITNNQKNHYFAQGRYKHLQTTEDGEMLKNGYNLKLAIEKKSEELVGKLDKLVEHGIDPEKKRKWLAVVRVEVAKFKRENKPEFFDVKNLPPANWIERTKYPPKSVAEVAK